jgi:ribose transport system ATP-binding protein
MLQITNLTKTFGPVQALKGISIDIRPNEVVGLIGENGAGKSTLMRILAGSHQPTSGEILLDGRPVQFRNSREAAAHGIGMVFQEQSLLLNLSVAENIYFGEERQFSQFGIINYKRMQEAARRQLDKIGVDIDVTARTSTLTFAARQMVELAKALTLEDALDRQLVILLDEPTSVLSSSDIEVLFTRVRALRERASFVFVSHRLDEVLEISDRVYTMKDGAVVDERAAVDASAGQLHRIMVGRGRQAEYYKEGRQKPPEDRIVVDTRKLGLDGLFQDVNLQIRAGEVVGIAGVVGSGREEVTRVLGGFVPHTEGEIRIEDAEVRFRSPGDAVKCKIGYIPRERRVEGLVMFLSIAENISLADLDAVRRNGLINHAAERELASGWIDRLKIKAPGPSTACRNLSGGNQQKVVLARWMAAGSRVLVLDHPTRGLDVGAKEEVYDLVRSLCETGMAVLLISDTLEETIGLSHRILVMRDGRVTARFDAPPGAKPEQVKLVEAMV